MGEKLIALVNGKEITDKNVKFALSKFPSDRRGYFETEEGNKQIVEQIISWELVYNHAVDTGYTDREDYKFQLEEAKKAILTQMAIEDILKNVSVDEKEIIEYYDQNKEYFMDKEEVNARHILVATEEEAVSIKKEIDGGLSFSDAAMKYSSCPSKEQGGSLGFFSKGVMVPEFENAAFSLTKGQISDPVKTQFGYHLILVDDKKPGKEKSLEEVKNTIYEHMIQEKQSFTYMNFVNELKKKYPVEMK